MKNILTLLCLIIASSSFAQIKMHGIVKDSIGAPLELANIIAINKESNTLESYAISDANGKYMLSLGKNGTYNVQVSYIGLKSVDETIETKEEDITKNFSLLSDNSLDAVELTYEMPVTIKGDTLIYNADSFKNGTERKLEDVLKKLPGVEINADGQIEVEGKVVNKLMVNGKDFFDGDSKLATKNIPSNAVDKVQVLRNYAEVGQLSGVQNNQDNVAINIRLKEGKENFWFGNVTAGGGVAPSPNDELYLVQPKLFYYSPDYSINVIGDLNNTGEVALTGRDIRNFGGGFRRPSNSSGTSINLGDNGLRGLTSLSDAQSIQSKLGALNFSYSPNKALDLSGFVIYNSNRLNTRQESFVRYTNPELGIPDEETVQTGKEATNQGLAKFSARYKPNANNQLDYDILGRISDDSEVNNEYSSVIGNTNQLNEAKPFSINQNVNYYYTLNDNNIFAFEAQHLFKDEDPFYNALLVNDPTNNDDADRDAFDNTAEGLGLDRTQFGYDLNQDRRIKSNQLDAKLDYYNILNSKSNINLTLGTILSTQKFNSNIFQFLDDGTFYDPTANLTNADGDLLRNENDIEYNFSDVYLGVHYRLKTGKFTITPGFSVHAYGNKNTQFGETYEDNFFKILPDFETQIQFKKSESLTFRYNMQNSFTDVTSLAEGLVMNNYNSIQYGEPELQNALSHNLSLRYFSFNLFNYTNVFAMLNYNKNIDQIRSVTNFDNVIRTNTYFNSNFADESVNFFGRVQRTYGKLRASLGVNYNYSKNNQFIQDIRSVNESFSQSYTPELRTNFREAPNVSLKYQYRVSNTNQGANDTQFITNAPSIEFDAYIWDALTFRTDYSYTKQSSNVGPSDSYQTWNANLSYRKDKDAKWEYELRASNLLNIDSNLNNGSNNISVYSSETFVLPRFITFRLTYTL
ncbi:outer membrane receptor protein involved in Fe transport [Winogradskyella epiphytica]|uniref:Outer membrane receptor protein involved in Fe transport n=1 Tax=Winogradskyella epiphytica TaxID=262005 RepID=A0A2V4XY66_9FLAO|nr:carboxypeptidase regulatory-like domain-containing protein [Winogradskyella epiphytica]PYE80688.1 outer membrane receptor protein involved in Fe transport [Winogradskyella epiphytica]